MPDASGLSAAIGPRPGSGDNEARGRSDCRTAPPASRRSQLGADRPEVGEGGLVQRSLEILGTGGSAGARLRADGRSEEHTSELQSQSNIVCRLLLEKKKKIYRTDQNNPRLNYNHRQYPSRDVSQGCSIYVADLASSVNVITTGLRK